jgi:hypothetical protein
MGLSLTQDKTNCDHDFFSFFSASAAFIFFPCLSVAPVFAYSPVRDASSNPAGPGRGLRCFVSLIPRFCTVEVESRMRDSF